MEKSFIKSVVSFFKSLGRREATGDPINADRDKQADKGEALQKTNVVHTEAAQKSSQASADEPSIDLTAEFKIDPIINQTIKLEPSEPLEDELTLPPELKRLQSMYSWRVLKAKKALPQQVIPDPFYFIDKDKQPVLANRSEVSFIKELLKKAAEAGIENKFQFALSKTHEIVIKYRYKVLGRVFLQGRKHRMVFKIDGNTYIVENLSLTECKKLLLIWIGQIRIPTKVINLMDKASVEGSRYSIRILPDLYNHRVFEQVPNEWQGCVGLPTFVLVDKYGEARYAIDDEALRCMHVSNS